MNIRKMGKTDYEQVFNIIKQVNNLHAQNRPDIYNDILPFKKQHKEHFYSLFTDESSILLVAEEKKKIIGLCMAEIKKPSNNPTQKPRKIVDINNIAVDENHRQQGIGKQLYNAVVDEAKRIKADGIELTVFGFNKNAIAFYKNLGMTVRNIKYEQKI